MSASAEPTGADVEYERFSPEYGNPMLSTIVTTSFAGNVLADCRIDVIAQRRHLLDPGSGPRAHVNLELSCIDCREKVLSKPWRKQSNRTGAQRSEREPGTHARMIDAESEHA